MIATRALVGLAATFAIAAALVGCAGPEVAARRGAAEAVVLRSLTASNADERARAVEIAGRAADAALDPALAERVGDSDARVRMLAIVALVADSKVLRPLLDRALESSNADERRIAIDAWKHATDPKAHIERLLSDPAPAVRWRAISALPGIDRDRARLLYPLLLDDADVGLRLTAIAGLPDLLETRAKEPLERVRIGDDLPSALRAEVALTRYFGDRAFSAVTRALAHTRAEIRGAAYNALSAMREPPASLFARAATDPDPDARLAAAHALADKGRVEEAKSFLVPLSQGAHHVDAISLLARLGDSAAKTKLLSLATVSDATVRRSALSAIAMYPDVEETLSLALRDVDYAVRLIAADALLKRTLPRR